MDDLEKLVVHLMRDVTEKDLVDNFGNHPSEFNDQDKLNLVVQVLKDCLDDIDLDNLDLDWRIE